MAVEKLMEIRIPERAEYIRVILAEFNRILSHLLWLGAFVQDIGLLGTVFLYGFREREKIQRMMETVTGARMHYHYFRYGGVAEDLTEEFPEEALKYLDGFDSTLDEFEEMIEDNEIFLVRTKGIGVLSAKDAINFGVSGPMLRASGVKIDLRKLEPYSVYSHFDFGIPVGKNGDCFDRYRVRMVEMRQSTRIIRQALQSLPPGMIKTPVPRRIKPPQGEAYVRTEHAKGEFGVYLISDGSHQPFRLKIRSPSFANLMVAPKILEGTLIPDLIATLGSIDIVMGCIDR
jgi:NADH-quinone oxidoreductase subunit D